MFDSDLRCREIKLDETSSFYAFQLLVDGYYGVSSTHFFNDVCRVIHSLKLKDKSYYRFSSNSTGNGILWSSHLREMYKIDHTGITQISIDLDFKFISYTDNNSILITTQHVICEYFIETESLTTVMDEFPFIPTMCFAIKDMLVITGIKKRNPRLFVLHIKPDSSTLKPYTIDALSVVDAAVSSSDCILSICSTTTNFLIRPENGDMKRYKFSDMSRLLKVVFINSTCITTHYNHTGVFTFQTSNGGVVTPPTYLCPVWKKWIGSECLVSIRSSGSLLSFGILGYRMIKCIDVGKIELCKFNSPKNIIQ